MLENAARRFTAQCLDELLSRSSYLTDLINYARSAALSLTTLMYRPFIYSTAMPRLNVAAIESSLDMLDLGHTRQVRPTLMGQALKLQAAAHVHALATYLLAHLRTIVPTQRILPPQVASVAEAVATGPASPAAAAIAAMPITSPIVPIVSSDPTALSRHLVASGYLVRPVRYPTVPRDQERVRICLHAGNTYAEVRGRSIRPH